MSYSLGKTCFLIWYNDDPTVETLLGDVLVNTYGFTKDETHKCFYILADGFDEEAILEYFEEQGYFDVNMYFWDYLNSYQVPGQV